MVKSIQGRISAASGGSSLTPKVGSLAEAAARAAEARRRREYYVENRNKILAKSRTYREKNKAQIAKKKKAYRRKVKHGVHKQRRRISSGNHGYTFVGLR